MPDGGSDPSRRYTARDPVVDNDEFAGLEDATDFLIETLTSRKQRSEQLEYTTGIHSHPWRVQNVARADIERS